jgi:hypothetical protein
MKPTVVILLSDKRSGSTMFQNELCQHPAVQHVEYSPHTYFETHHWLKSAVMLDMPPELFSGGKVYGGYGGKKNARIYMEDCISKNIPGFVIPDDDKELVFAGWNALCERYATPVFFEKSPQVLAHRAGLELLLEWIEKTDYKVKIIGLVRNPLAVLYSAQKLFHTDPEKRQYGWIEIQQNLLEFKKKIPESDFMLCRYEDMIQHPSEEFAKICGFIGVEIGESIGKGVRAGSLNKWRDNPFFAIQLDDSVKAMAYQFGYSDTELFNPQKKKPSGFYRLRARVEGELRLFKSRLYDRFIIPRKLRK